MIQYMTTGFYVILFKQAQPPAKLVAVLVVFKLGFESTL